jgi:tetratricopeptide (TPR) repeat protein
MPFLGRSTLHDFIDLVQAGVAPTLLQVARKWEQPFDRIDDRACPQMRRTPLGAYDSVFYLGERLADALASAHHNGIVHGDVKPSNVLVSLNGEPLLMDFNLSGDAARSIGARGGTLPYMPPEQLRAVVLGDPAVISHCPQSDIFSLGVVLYEALTGRLPFAVSQAGSEIANLAEDLLKRQRAGFTPLRFWDPTISPTGAACIERCLQFQPQDRPRSADVVRQQLEAEGKLYRRTKNHVLINCRKYAALAAAAVLGLFILTAYLAGRPPKEERLLRQALAFQQTGAFEAAEANLADAIAIRPAYVEAQFELARTVMLRKDLKRAREAFYKLAMTESSPRAAAYVAYCFNLAGDPAAAIAWYEKAKQMGCDVPEVHNNLAVSYELGRSRYSESESLQLSEQALQRAMQQAPSLLQVRLNWIYHAIRKARILGMPVSREIIPICRQLASEMPDCQLVHERSARAFASLTDASQEEREEGVQFLRKAVELGLQVDLPNLRESPSWLNLRNVAGFQQLIRDIEASTIPAVKSIHVARLLEPK